MKTSEFIEKVEKLEFVSRILCDSREDAIAVKNKMNDTLIVVETKTFGVLDSRFTVFSKLSNIQKHQLITLAFEYAATPISERKDKTIEEKAREYIQEYASDHLSFESARDFLECCNLYITDNGDFKNLIMHSYEEIAEYSKIYDWYRDNSNEFVKLWCEVAADEH